MFDRLASQQRVVPQSILATCFTVAHSIRARGLRHTLLFAALGVTLPTAAEYIAVNRLNLFQHHSYPQVQGVALSAALGWYNIGYASYAVIETIDACSNINVADRRWVRSLAAAAIATSLDLIVDCVGLDLGLWEWTHGGPYARDITGPNGQAGIPIANFIAWIVLTSGVTALYQRFADDKLRQEKHRWAAGSPRAGRAAALLLSPYYVAALAWTIEHRKWRLLVYSCICPLAITTALLGRFRHN